MPFPSTGGTTPPSPAPEPEPEPEPAASISPNTLALPFTQLNHYLNTSTLLTTLHESSPLYFHIPTTSPIIPPPLLSRTYNSLRLDFSPHTSTLRIWIPTPLHESIQFFAFEMLSTIAKPPSAPLVIGTIAPFRLPTALYIHESGSTTDHGTTCKPPPLIPTANLSKQNSHTSTTRKGKKKAITMKTPNYAYLPKGSLFPTVVFEVAWTQAPVDLFSDAEQWLVNSGGEVQLVVTVLFVEHNSPLAERTRELQRRIDEAADSAVLDEDGEKGGDLGSDGTLTPTPSTASDYILENQEIDPSQWVGDISAKVNFYRYSKATGQMYKDGEEYVLAPDGTISPTNIPQPRLSIRDIWGPSVEQENDAGAQTACVWDWELLKEYLERARRDYAFNRKKDLEKAMGSEWGAKGGGG